MKTHSLANHLIVYRSIRVLKSLNFFSCQYNSKVNTCLVEHTYGHNRIITLLRQASIDVFPFKTKFVLDIGLYMTPTWQLCVKRLNTWTWFKRLIHSLWFLFESSFWALTHILLGSLWLFNRRQNGCNCTRTLSR